MKQTAQEIIQEALDYRYNEERRSKFGILDRLFDFSTWGSGYERKADASSIMYLTDRLLQETHRADEAEKRADGVYRAGVRTVEIYGPEAVDKFHQMFPAPKD